jgi:hypothetical protein
MGLSKPRSYNLVFSLTDLECMISTHIQRTFPCSLTYEDTSKNEWEKETCSRESIYLYIEEKETLVLKVFYVPNLNLPT